MKKLLLAYDGSECSRRAAAQAAGLASALGASVLVIVVGELLDTGHGSSVPALDPAQYEEFVNEAAQMARDAGVDTRGRVEWGRPGETISDVASTEGVDLIVMGHRGRKGLATLLLGSVARYVIDHARCSVLVVR
jgi:nucleotide-binding universal stress UspA family protein